MDAKDLTEAAVAAGIASFEATHGGVPASFQPLLRHAPSAFAGYGLMRAGLMKDTDAGGALDLKTKELVFTLLDVLVGQTRGAKAHAANAVRLGLTLPELAEGLVQCIMVGGITVWNVSGAEVMAHAEAVAAERG
ncbi:carboxymuconolactone decarboxylase family protein [Falsiroseomonas oryzae]|uniref:carboxymuconolactone decarboxylase family protein n=1 Tax=Falsiroseomonas oryzae TaxID=2766473 RepID=UPI0022EB5412|nr:carboxymuconolactone decarboxylase family protein [Roseomonas sp. MO-31]